MKNKLFLLLILLSTKAYPQACSNVVLSSNVNQKGGAISLNLTTSTSANLSLQDWQYITITKDNSNNGKLYKNGQLIYSGSYLNLTYTWSKLILGAVFYTTYNGFFKGWIDEVRMSNTVLSAQDVLNNYNANQAFTSNANTIGLWHFDQSTGSIVNASVGTSGTITNATWDPNGKFGSCLYYNGTNARVEMLQSIPTSNMSFEFWIKPEVLQKDKWPISWYGGNTAGFGLNTDTTTIYYVSSTITQDTIKACGDSVMLSATSGLSTYLWNTGATSSSIYAKNTGWYNVKTVNANGCIGFDSVFVSVLHVDINQKDTTVCANTVLNLKAGLVKPRLTNLFNGTSTYFEMPLPGPIGATQRTFAYWLKSNKQSTMTVLTYGSALNGGPDIVDLCLNLNMGYGAGSGGCAQYNKGVSSFSNSHGATFGKLVTDSVWHHIAYVMGTGNNYSFQNFKVYVDGHLVSMNANGIPYCGHNWGGWTYNTSSSVMRIGRNYSNNPYSSYFKGDLDELAVWSKALDSAQINKIMSLGVMSLDTQLMYYYNFDKLVGDTLLTDLKSGNHGVLKGGLANYATSYFLDTSTLGNTYLWSTGATTSSINVTPTQTTKYWVKVSNGISSCTDTITITVQNPTAPVVSNVTYCQGAAASALTATASAGNSLLWYSTATGGSASTAIPTPSTSTAGSITYYVSQITPQGCESARAALTVTVNALPQVSITASKTPIICTGDSVVFSVSPQVAGQSYVWYKDGVIITGATNTSYAAKQSGAYSVKVTNSNGCSITTATSTLNVYPWPTVNAGPDKEVPAGTSVDIITQTSNAQSIAWSPVTGLSCINCASPTATVNFPIVYIVTVTSAGGCSVSDTVSIQLVCEEDLLYMPNTFTPNGDGENDRFYPMGKGLGEVTVFRIVNRLGQVVYTRSRFAINNASYGWDGTFNGADLGMDVYSYYIEVPCPTGQIIKKTGDISLLR